MVEPFTLNAFKASMALPAFALIPTTLKVESKLVNCKSTLKTLHHCSSHHRNILFTGSVLCPITHQWKHPFRVCCRINIHEIKQVRAGALLQCFLGFSAYLEDVQSNPSLNGDFCFSAAPLGQRKFSFWPLWNGLTDRLIA